MSHAPVRAPHLDEPARPLPPGITRQGDAALWTLLTLFFVMSALWALRVPFPLLNGIGQWASFNPDEGSHINVIVFTATHHALPVFSDAWLPLGEPFPHVSNYYVCLHPPFYHVLGALIYALLAPLIGGDRALMALRLLSCAMGTSIVWFTYQTARELASREAALLAAGCVAGVPMFVSMSAAISNENLASLASAASLYLIVVGLRRGFDWRRAGALAIWVAVGVGSKFTCLSLIPAACLAFWLAGAWNGQAIPERLSRMLVVLVVSAISISWWLLRNHHLYGSYIAIGLTEREWDLMQPGYALVHMYKGTSVPFYLFRLAAVGWRSFWGQFNGMERPLPAVICGPLFVLQAAIGVGLWRAWRRGAFSGVCAAAAKLMALAASVILVIYVDYNWKHFTPQGRYFFPLLVPFGLCMAGGWRALFSPRWLPAATLLLLLGLGLLNVYSLVVYTRP